MSDAGSYTFSRRERWTDDEWDRLLLGRPEATFFHTRAWARIVTAAFPACLDRCVWFDVNEIGGDNTAPHPILLPLFAWRRAAGLLVTLHSSFPFLYGGPIGAFDSGGGTDWVGRLLPQIRSRRTSVHVTGNPFGARDHRSATAAPQSASDGVPGFTTVTNTTQVLRLPDTEEEYWEKSLSSRRRNDVRRLKKKGVSITESRREDDILAIHRFYRDSFQRWGGEPTFVHPAEFYLYLAEQGGDNVRLTVARFEDRIIGGSFTVRWNGMVHYIAGYIDNESRALRPNVLLQIESIRQAIRDGYRLYDFLPSGGHESVEKFKAGLGGLPVEFPIFESHGLPHQLMQCLRRRGAS